jgi:hypothetical protein
MAGKALTTFAVRDELLIKASRVKDSAMTATTQDWL